MLIDYLAKETTKEASSLGQACGMTPDLWKRGFSVDSERKAALENHFEQKSKDYFFKGIHELCSQCEKCISLEKNYIEK